MDTPPLYLNVFKLDDGQRIWSHSLDIDVNFARMWLGIQMITKSPFWILVTQWIHQDN
jgi:hypothetical protein